MYVREFPPSCLCRYPCIPGSHTWQHFISSGGSRKENKRVAKGDVSAFILIMLSTWLTYWPHPSFGKHIKVTGILYLHNITNNRLTEPLPQYGIFRKLCGNEYPAKVVLVLTMCENSNPVTWKVYLTNHWKRKMGERAAVYSYYGTKKSAWDVVTALGVLNASEVSSFCPREVRSSRGIDAEASSVHPQEPVPVRDLSNWSRPRGPIHTLTVPCFRSVSQCDSIHELHVVFVASVHGKQCVISYVCRISWLSPLSLWPCNLQTQSFHSTILPNLRESVYSALTTFETGICPWTHPSEWLDVNTSHIRSIFDGIVSTANADIEPITFPATMIFQVCWLTFRLSQLVLIVPQRLIVYIFAHHILCTLDQTYFFFLLFFSVLCCLMLPPAC